MTPEKGNIIIAEICGWTAIQQGSSANGRRIIAVSPANKGRTSGGGLIFHEIPNYFGSLDAMHEATLSSLDKLSLRANFQTHLLDTVRRDNPQRSPGRIYFLCTNATAPQRWEAFIRVFGKWEDEA